MRGGGQNLRFLANKLLASPFGGSGLLATKESAVAYTRLPSCCEPWLYSATCYICTPDVSV